MKEYNAPFFTLFENVYKVLLGLEGEGEAVEIFRKVVEMGLKKAYDLIGFQKGNVADFVRVLQARDNAVGLLVKFPEVSDDKIVYQFYTDPFPNLKNIVPSKKLDDTYIAFKIKYLLGDEWSYITTKHLWTGDECTEFTIIRK